MNIRRIGTIFVIFGLVLIFSALSLLFYNSYQEQKAYKETENVLSALESETQNSTQDDSSDEITVDVNGYDYIGFIEIPKIEIKLPVLSEWDYTRLKIAPCRQFGSINTDDIVIAAHNYKKHFGNLSSLNIGDEIILTDTSKKEHLYSVERVEILNPTDVEKVQNSGYDLVLYTCTYGGKTRVTLFCNKRMERSYEYYYRHRQQKSS